MRGFPFVIIAVLFCLNALDGFDALAISFAAPGMTHEWGTSPQALGVVISLGLLATGFGSLGVAPLADKFGRHGSRLPPRRRRARHRRNATRRAARIAGRRGSDALFNHIFPANFDSKGLVLCSF